MFTIVRDGQKIELTWEECHEIVMKWQRDCHLEDLENICGGTYSFDSQDEEAYVRGKLDTALDTYEKELAACGDWVDAACYVIGKIAEEYRAGRNGT